MKTLEEIDGELALLPASPTTDADISSRAALMVARIEMINAARQAAAAPKPQTGGIVINVPPNIGALQTSDGKIRNVEIVDDRRIVRLSGWADFIALLRGREGLEWQNLNSEPGGAIERLAAANLRL
jgi:hypothetical protein